MTPLGDITILLVDDDGVWRAALASWLEREGFRVLGLSRGDRVASALESRRVDAMILDVRLPGLDGLEVLAEVRRRWPGLPVIVTTAFGGSETGDVARRRGATGYLDKPFRMAELLTQLRRLVTPGERTCRGRRR
jgi:DNA-binding response OmpR family regulator